MAFPESGVDLWRMPHSRELKDELDLIRRFQGDLAKREEELVARIKLLRRGGRREAEYQANSISSKITAILNDDISRIWTPLELLKEESLQGVDRDQVHTALSYLAAESERVTRIKRGHYQSVLAHGGKIQIPVEPELFPRERLKKEVEALLNATRKKVWKLGEIMEAIPEMAEGGKWRRVMTQLVTSKRIRRVKCGHYASVASVAFVRPWKQERVGRKRKRSYDGGRGSWGSNK